MEIRTESSANMLVRGTIFTRAEGSTSPLSTVASYIIIHSCMYCVYV